MPFRVFRLSESWHSFTIGNVWAHPPAIEYLYAIAKIGNILSASTFSLAS